MNLEEANERLRNKITQEQLDKLTDLYIILDLHKDVFCKIVNAVGVQTLLEKQKHYARLNQAEQELCAKEKYLYAKARLDDLESEKTLLQEIIDNYNNFHMTSLFHLTKGK